MLEELMNNVDNMSIDTLGTMQSIISERYNKLIKIKEMDAIDKDKTLFVNFCLLFDRVNRPLAKTAILADRVIRDLEGIFKGFNSYDDIVFYANNKYDIDDMQMVLKQFYPDFYNRDHTFKCKFLKSDMYTELGIDGCMEYYFSKEKFEAIPLQLIKDGSL